MRIGLFTDTYPPFINGVSTSVNMLKNALEREGHEVYVVTVNENFIKYKEEDDEHILRIPGIPTGIYDYRLTGIYPIKAVQKIKSWNLDIIHSHTEFGIGTFARIIAKQYHIPIVHTYHTMYEDYVQYVTHGYFDKSAKKLLEYLTKFYCDKTVQKLIVPTKKTYDLFKDKYHVDKDIYIIPTGLEVDKFYLENLNNSKINELRKDYHLSKNDFVIVFAGRLASEKNIETSINACAKLIKKYKNIKFLIIGSGPDEESYKELVKELDISSNVIFTGKIPYDMMPYYYHLGDIFTTASLSETQGLTVIEAMASNLAVVAIDDPAFRNVIDDELDGLLFKDDNSYVEKMECLYKNKDKLNKIAKQGVIKSRRFSSLRYAQSVMDVYIDTINNKNVKSGNIFSKFLERLRGGDK